MGEVEYFGVNRESILMDGRAAGNQASCYGVNLAFVRFGVWEVGVGFVFSIGRLCASKWRPSPKLLAILSAAAS